MNTSVQVTIPESLTTALALAGYTPETLSDEARRALAAFLYKRQTLTLAQAAELAQMTLRDFIPYLALLGIPALNYPPNELEFDEASVEWQLQQSR